MKNDKFYQIQREKQIEYEKRVKERQETCCHEKTFEIVGHVNCYDSLEDIFTVKEICKKCNKVFDEERFSYMDIPESITKDIFEYFRDKNNE